MGTNFESPKNWKKIEKLLNAQGSTPSEQSIDSFWSKVEKTDGCWNWLSTKNPGGYGQFRQWRAHRFAYELLVGEIPSRLVIDHLCRNRACVNPDHLEAVTNKENILRGVGAPALNAKLTVCGKGHPFTPENTYVPPNHPSHRYCRACKKIRKDAHTEKLRQQRQAKLDKLIREAVIAELETLRDDKHWTAWSYNEWGETDPLTIRIEELSNKEESNGTNS